MRLAPTVMVQGTASSVGKSMVASALCRIFRDQGLKVAPFKAQNMALNAFVCPDGSEIGRAQAAQADACGVVPTADMNPVLLKPESDRRSQVVVLGKAIGSMAATAYHDIKPKLRETIVQSLTRLRQAYDVVVIEGAGSPAEINLKQSDIVNMFVARSVRSPVLLVGDIDRGGVFAALVGTLELLDPEERDLVAGFIINKFRGDPALLEPGLDFLREKTAKGVLGVLPYMHRHRIPEEDSLGLDERMRRGSAAPGDLRIAILRLPRISNYDEFESLEHEPGVSLRYVDDPAVRLDHDLIIIPGTKNTLVDLGWLEEHGFAAQIKERVRRGQPVLGICGGCQMLGHRIDDSAGVETEGRIGMGLALLPFDTVFSPAKITAQVRAKVARSSFLTCPSEQAADVVSGYEIHAGVPVFHGEPRGLFIIEQRNGQAAAIADGAVSDDGVVVGTMVHGILDNGCIRRRLLDGLAARRGLAPRSAPVAAATPDADYDRLAAVVRGHLDMAALHRIVFGRERP